MALDIPHPVVDDSKQTQNLDQLKIWEVALAESLTVMQDEIDALIAASVPDATTTVKGKLKLAGDLSGTADLPTVPGLTAKADLASPALTGNPTAPTQSAGNNSTRLATTAYVDTADALKAPLASPTFTGDPKAPTPSTSDNDTSVATTAYVKSNLSSYAPLASPALTGNPTAPTPSPGDADTSIATTGFVDLEVGLAAAGFTVRPQADYATVQALDSYVGTGTGTLEASVNGDLLDALGLESERWDYSLTFAHVGSPYAIARDSSGNFYITSTTFTVQIVAKFDSSGQPVNSFSGVNYFGANGSGNGQFGGVCYGITVDSSGNIYVADTANRRIQKFNSSGVYQAQVGSGGTGNGQFGASSPRALAVDSSNNVFAADAGNTRVQKFNSSLVYQSQFGSAGTGNGQFTFPAALTIDSSNNIFVAEEGDRVQKFNSSGTYQSQFGSAGAGVGQLDNPAGITVDSSGNIYVADSNNHRVQKFNSSGTYVSGFGSVGAGHGQFVLPLGIAVDGSGNLYVCDYGRVEKFLYTAAPSVATGQSVIVKDQNFTGPHVDHGVYEIDATGGVSSKWRLIRRDDMDTSAEIMSGLLVNVKQRGSIIPGGMWYVSTADPITIGSTALTWEQFLPGGYPTAHAASHLSDGNDPIVRPLVTSLPSSPIDGAEVLFDTGTEGVVWHFRYNANSSSSYKWEYLGGPPLKAESNTGRSLTNQTSYTSLATDPLSITLPLTGDYDIEIGAVIQVGASGNGFISYATDPGGTNASDNHAVSVALGTNGHQAEGSKERRLAGLTGGNNIAEKAKTGGNYTITFNRRRLSLRPVRVA